MLSLVGDCIYPSYDPFEDLEFDHRMYEDADEALAALDRRSQRKRYMVGLFPGVNETFLHRGAIREFLPLVPLYETMTFGCRTCSFYHYGAQMSRQTRPGSVGRPVLPILVSM